MPNQVITIDPQHELKFKGMFEQGCTTYLRLGNPTLDTVLFKIKTTAPKKYCVRPNSGSLDPNSKVEIAITPQHVYIDPNEKHKHKFMVQSVIAPEGNTNVDQVWKDISIDQLMDYKLKCVFESPRVVNANLNNLTSPKSENVENEVNRSYEVAQLREEETKLRHENLQLKEELLRLRQMCGDGRAQRAHMFGPEKQAQGNVMPWLAIAVAMALFGIIIGKFFM